MPPQVPVNLVGPLNQVILRWFSGNMLAGVAQFSQLRLKDRAQPALVDAGRVLAFESCEKYRQYQWRVASLQ